jgi:hypothetical protein
VSTKSLLALSHGRHKPILRKEAGSSVQGPVSLEANGGVINNFKWWVSKNAAMLLAKVVRCLWRSELGRGNGVASVDQIYQWKSGSMITFI